MSKIQNIKKRQPLMLRNDVENEWLRNDLTKNDLIELMQPLNESYMNAHTVKKNNPKSLDINNTDIINEYEYPELAFYED